MEYGKIEGTRQMENRQREIIGELIRRIDSGAYTEKLPSARELAAEFRVNIKTANKAVLKLAASGRVERKRRAGTRIRRGAETAEPLIEVLFEGFASIFSHPFWNEIWHGITEVLLAENFRPVLHMIEADPKTGILNLEQFTLTPSAGKNLLGIGEKRLFDLVAATGVPFIAGCDRINDPAIPQIAFDFRRGISDAVEYLHRNGVRKIAFIGRTHHYISLGYLHKFESYLAAIQRYSVIDPALIGNAEPVPGSGAAAVRAILAEGGRPEGVIAAYDHQLPEIVSELKEHGLTPPVIGCDGLPLEGVPPLRPEILAPRKKCGELLARSLVDAIRRGGTPESRTLPAVFYQ